MKNPSVKIYKNKQRSEKEVFQPYVPQYKVLEVEPLEYKSSLVPINTPVIRPTESANRNRQPAIRREPSLEEQQSILPSVAHMQQTWSSVDGNIIDDAFENDGASMIDNNDFYTDESLGNHPQVNRSQSSSNDLSDVVNDLDVDSYLLLVKGEPICSGPIEEIEDQTRALIFGEHDLCGGEPIPEEDLIVLKKLKIKVGVFLG
jgi:hypothetical protein